MRLLTWLFRASGAVIAGILMGYIAQIPFAFLLDLIWQDTVTGGRWALNIPNIILICLSGLVTGFTTGWIAGKWGKSLAAVAILSPFLFTITYSIVRNQDLFYDVPKNYDTQPALWIYIGLIPAILGGHFGAQNGKRNFHYGIGFLAIGLMIVSVISSILLHLYTAYIFYDASWGAALIALGFPVFSELFLFWKTWHTTGHFLTTYNVYCLSVVAFWGARFLSVVALASTEKWAVEPIK